MTTPLLTAAQVGPLLGEKSADWVIKQARAGRIPHRRIGRAYLFTEQDVQDYIDSARAGGRTVATVSGFTTRSGKRRAS